MTGLPERLRKICSYCVCGDCETVAEAADALEAAEAQLLALRGVLGFFASVIKSGEPWSETCEKEYRAALSGGDT